MLTSREESLAWFRVRYVISVRRNSATPAIIATESPIFRDETRVSAFGHVRHTIKREHGVNDGEGEEREEKEEKEERQRAEDRCWQCLYPEYASRIGAFDEYSGPTLVKLLPLLPTSTPVPKPFRAIFVLFLPRGEQGRTPLARLARESLGKLDSTLAPPPPSIRYFPAFKSPFPTTPPPPPSLSLSLLLQRFVVVATNKPIFSFELRVFVLSRFFSFSFSLLVDRNADSLHRVLAAKRLLPILSFFFFLFHYCFHYECKSSHDGLCIGFRSHYNFITGRGGVTMRG